MVRRTLSIQTPIGECDRTSCGRTNASDLTAAAVVCAHVWLVWTGRTSLIGL